MLEEQTPPGVVDSEMGPTRSGGRTFNQWLDVQLRARKLTQRQLDPIGSCQASTPQLGSKSRPLRQTPQTMLSALRMQWPSAFIFDLPAARFRA